MTICPPHHITRDKGDWLAEPIGDARGDLPPASSSSSSRVTRRFSTSNVATGVIAWPMATKLVKQLALGAIFRELLHDRPHELAGALGRDPRLR